MKEFFMIIFFSKIVLLTPNPIDIKGKYDIKLKEPISAITEGASLQIDVTSIIKNGNNEDIVELRKKAKKLFQKGSIGADLLGEQSTVIKMVYSGNVMLNKDNILLTLNSEREMPLRVNFDKIRIYSDMPLEKVKLLWKNYKK